MRASKRNFNQLREIKIEPNFMQHADGSCLISVGNTKISCTASIEEKVPLFLRNSKTGWLTAEYSMLPCATNFRTSREVMRGKQSGRSQEIQRLIGRSLRAVLDLKLLGERQIIIDCDVLQADGGTRTASITGGYVALNLALRQAVAKKMLNKLPLIDSIAAVSCGIYNEEVILDLDYVEDSAAQVDANFVITGSGGLVEIQSTAEKKPFTIENFNQMFKLANQGIEELKQFQTQALYSGKII